MRGSHDPPVSASMGATRSGALLRTVCVLVFAAFTVGCASVSTSVEAGQQPASEKWAITVLRTDSFRFDWDREISPVKVDLERCARKAIQDHLPELRYISRSAFTGMAFPNLPSEVAPIELRNIRTLLDSPVFTQRIRSMNLRYIIYVGGHTEIKESHAWVEIGGYMAATMVGGSTWEKDTKVSAVVLDLQNPAVTHAVEEHETGTSWVAGLFPLIIGAPASTEARACRDIGEQVVRVLKEAQSMEKQR